MRQIVIQQKEETSLKEGTIRREILDEVMKWFDDKRIIILTGLRRSGKSTLLKQIMREKKDWCYVNFDDERFIGFQAQDFESLNEVLIEVYGNPKTYFFDEIQNVDRFETFVRRLHDHRKKVLITGSNASLLSKELGTRLTGRYRSFEVYPFSFFEYLKFRKLNPKKEWLYIAEKKVMLLKAFEEYLADGGLPEYLKNKDREYVKTLFENILYRDVIARYSIRRQKIVKELVHLFATNMSTKFTYNSLKKSLGLSNAITVKEYTSYLNNAYLFFELQRFDLSAKKQLNFPKKIYIADSAFGQLGFNLSENVGKVIENAVFLELRRRNKEAYYYSNKSECDFVVKDGIRITEAIQVCYVLDEKNKEREVKGLTDAMERFGLKEGVILTKDQEDEIKADRRIIKIMPVFKWLLLHSSTR